MTREVVVTGMGAITPLGASVASTWNAALEGRSGAARIDRFDPAETRLRSKIACVVPDDPDSDGFDPDGDGFDPDDAAIDERRTGRYAQYAAVTADRALADAGVDPGDDAWPADRVGTSIGTGFAGLPEIEAAVGGRPSTGFVPSTLANLAAGHVSIRVDARGPSNAPATACTAGAQAIGTAADDIRLGRADVMIAGGTEACVSPLGVGGFDAMRALSTRNDEPAAASRPFDADRDGFVIGEGAGVLVLEAREHATERGATPYATLAGYGESADAHHVTQPPDDARGMVRCLRRALEDADLPPRAVDHVNAHGTGTPRGDAHEATALNAVFDACPPVTSSKSMIGHALGAAGAVESVIAVQSLRDGTVPPTINYETPDPDCDVPVVTEPRNVDLDAVLTTSAGFGGGNAALAFATP